MNAAVSIRLPDIAVNGSDEAPKLDDIEAASKNASTKSSGKRS